MSAQHGVIVGVVGLVIWAGIPGAPGVVDERKPKELASVTALDEGVDLGPVFFDQTSFGEKGYGGFVIRNAEELAARSRKAKERGDPKVRTELERDLGKLFKVEGIDWSKQMVLGVYGGVCREEHTLSLVSFAVKEKALTVTWKMERTKGNNPWSSPRLLALVERFDGRVEFKFQPEK